jgi:PAS domain S-box-containing protein
MSEASLPSDRLAELALLHDVNPGPVLQIDRQGDVQFANAAARALLGDAVLETSWIETCPGLDRTRWDAVLAADGPATYEVCFEGTWVDFTQVHPIGSDSVFVFGTDVTEHKAAEHALEEQRARLAEVARFPDMNPGPVLRLDLDGDIVLANAAARDVFGEDLVGRCWRDVCPAIGEREWASVLAVTEPMAIEVVINEQTFVFTHRRDDVGRLVFVYGSDVTRQRESERLVRALLASTAEGIYGVDLHGLCTFVNPAALRLLGYGDPAELMGRNMHELIHHTRPDGSPYPFAECEIVRKLGRHELVHIDTELLWRRDGTSFPAEYWAHPILQDGKLIGSVLTFLDITERRRAEDDLRAAMQAANEANAAKSQFLAGMSHELRTPMNAILGYSEILIEDAETRGDEDMLSDLQKINTAGKHLLELINAVLDLSKIEAGRMDLYLETFDISRLLDDVTSTVEPLMRKNDNELVVRRAPALGSMHADVTKVRQALFNLLSNAAKFTENGTVSLEVRRDRVGDDEFVVLAVSDTGIGIPEDKLDLVFDEFAQADSSTSRRYGGTGLGLALTARFCRMMGGDIALESAPGVGSTFTITFPARVRAVEAVGETPSAGGEPTRGDLDGDRPILVVDDDPHARELLTRALEADGHAVVTASGGHEAVAMARRTKPALITLDILMSDMDGWSVLRSLKSDPDLREIPVVVISIVADRDAGHVMGAVDSLAKPVDRSALLDLVRRHAAPGGAGNHALIVEDDADVRSLIRVYLESDGWTTSEAETGLDGLHRIDEWRPDVIVLDLMMPEMNGFDFLDALRTRDDGRPIPVVVVTAMDLTEDDRARLRGNVERIVEKGGQTGSELVRRLRELMPRAANRRAAAGDDGSTNSGSSR